MFVKTLNWTCVMINRYLLLIGTYCCFVFQTKGMELALKEHKRHKLVSYKGEQDIPFFPLVRSKYLPSIRNILVKHNNVHDDLLCKVALLPKELRESIVLKMFDNNSIATKVFLKTPFFYAINFVHQDKQLLDKGLFLKEIALDKLFCSSSQIKKNAISIALSQHPVSLFYDDYVFTQKQIEQIRLLEDQEIDTFFSGAQVMVVEPEATWKKYSYLAPCGCAGVGFVSTGIVATTACLAGHCSNFIFIVGGVTVGTSCLLGAIGAGLIYAHVVKNNIRSEVI